jgi:RNA polymerase sigma factor (sigma-70 family)
MMDSNYPQAIQTLKHFESDDPNFYNSPLFHWILVRIIFEQPVRRKTGGVIKVPFGLRQDDPDIDELTDKTFKDVMEKLDGKKIAQQTSPLARYVTCRAFVMRVATNNAIDFLRKNPFVWNHGDIADDLLWRSVTQGEYMSLEAATQADSELQEKEERIKQTLREFLRPVMSERNFEFFWLRHVRKLEYKELSVRFDKTEGALRVKFYLLLKKAKSILDDPLVRKRMLGEDNDKHN